MPWWTSWYGSCSRPPYALGWTKRVVNWRMKDHMLRSLELDSSVAFEMINYLQHKLGGASGAWQPERSDAVAD